MTSVSSHKDKLARWTRDGILHFPWSSFETLEKLVLTPSLREKLSRRLTVFVTGQESFHALRLPWRFGIFFFGPSGTGKSSAGRAIARTLGWHHFTIPAHEILDSHLFERALAAAVSKSHRVIVLEDVDVMIRSMEPEVFFTLLDHAMERSDGMFWIANSRHPDEAPKMQLLRPGRFDEAIRLEPPFAELRSDLLSSLVPDSELKQWVEETAGLTFSHFEELRQIAARLKMENASEEAYVSELRTYIEDQLIAGDRWGGVSDKTIELRDRVKQVDERLLMAALDMTDVFKRLIEKVIGNAAEKAREAEAQGDVE